MGSTKLNVMMTPEMYQALVDATTKASVRSEWADAARKARDEMIMAAVEAGATSSELEKVTGLHRSGIDEVKRRTRRQAVKDSTHGMRA